MLVGFIVYRRSIFPVSHRVDVAMMIESEEEEGG